MSPVRTRASLARKPPSDFLAVSAGKMQLLQDADLLALSDGGAVDGAVVRCLPATLRLELGAGIGADADNPAHSPDVHRSGTLVVALCADHSRDRAWPGVFHSAGPRATSGFSARCCRGIFWIPVAGAHWAQDLQKGGARGRR